MKESQFCLFFNTSKEPFCKCHNHIPVSDHGAHSVQENPFHFCTHADVNHFLVSVMIIIVTVDIPDDQELNFR